MGQPLSQEIIVLNQRIKNYPSSPADPFMASCPARIAQARPEFPTAAMAWVACEWFVTAICWAPPVLGAICAKQHGC